MSTTVDRIKEACTKKNVSISRLERECGFSNGYIRVMKGGSMSAERLQKIATYLNVSFDWLLTGEEKEEQGGYYIDPEAAEMAQRIYDNEDLRLLFDAAKDVTPEQLKLLHNLALSWKVSK